MKNEATVRKYNRLAFVYDFLFSSFFKKARKKLFSTLVCRPGDRLLLAGVGTGEDFEYLPDEAETTGIDLSEQMLAKAKYKVNGKPISLMMMNAEKMDFPDESFDTVILNLILSVAEDPRVVFSESVRVAKPNGTIAVFDKFIRKGKKPSPIRRFLNFFTSFVGTDINRCFEEISEGYPVEVMTEMKMMFRGNYRIILLKK